MNHELILSKYVLSILFLFCLQHEHKTDENQNSDDDVSLDSAVVLEEAMAALSILPNEVPAPHPPSCRKRDLYYDAEIFKELDEHVFSVRVLFS